MRKKGRDSIGLPQISGLDTRFTQGVRACRASCLMNSSAASKRAEIVLRSLASLLQITFIVWTWEVASRILFLSPQSFWMRFLILVTDIFLEIFLLERIKFAGVGTTLLSVFLKSNSEFLSELLFIVKGERSMAFPTSLANSSWSPKLTKSSF